jgi:hypothetical protein
MRFLLAALLVGCGSGDLGGADAGPADAGVDSSTPAKDYFPLVTGASWTYRVTDPLNPGAPAETKTQTVEAFEDVEEEKAGVMAYRLVTRKPGDETRSWQIKVDGVLVRHAERAFDVVGSTFTPKNTSFFYPYKVRIDGNAEHTAMGATYDTTHNEKIFDSNSPGGKTISKTERWTVEATAEEVTVPAGTFTAIRLRRVVLVGAGGDEGADKTFWFAEGVGKVKETGGQTEELMSYTIP